MRLHTLPVLASLGHLSQRERQGVIALLRSAVSRRERQGMIARYTDMYAKSFPTDITAGSSSPLALPLGELSPQVTERAFRYGCLPSPSSLRSATSPKGRGKG